MELWPGYVTAVQQYDGGLLLMLDVSHRLIRTDTALDFLLVVTKHMHISIVGASGFMLIMPWWAEPPDAYSICMCICHSVRRKNSVSAEN